MPALDILIAFTAASLLMNLSPGPSNLYVMARAVAQGSRGGITAAAGLAVGSLVHVVATVLGLSVVFSHSPLLYTTIKLAGAAYLVYLGIGYWKAAPLGDVRADGARAVRKLPAVFRESILIELTNPKTALFFIAFLPQFVQPESGPVAQQLLLLGFIVTVTGLLCDLGVAVFSSRLAGWLFRHARAQQFQQRVSGSILIGLGGYIVGDEIRPSG